jgi:hypothetical protein
MSTHERRLPPMMNPIYTDIGNGSTHPFWKLDLREMDISSGAAKSSSNGSLLEWCCLIFQFAPLKFCRQTHG